MTNDYKLLIYEQTLKYLLIHYSFYAIFFGIFFSLNSLPVGNLEESEFSAPLGAMFGY